MGKSADEDVSQNIYRSQVLTESNFDTNDKELLHMEKEIDVQEGPLLTDGEDGDNVNSAKKLKIQTGNCQLSFYNSDIFDLANSEELIKTDRNIDTNLAQNKTELSISKSNFSTGNINISFVENKGQESPKQNTDNSSVGINPKDKNNVISSHSTSLHVNSATRDIGKRDCNVTKKDILNTSYSIYKKPIVHHHEKVLSTSDVVEPQFQTTTSNENNENSVKGLSSNSNSAKIDELTIDKKGQDFLWTFIEGSSQSNNGTALSSSGKKSDACYDTSSLYDQSGLTFEDHDLFCDSCEDFHPRTQAMQQSCQKHKKVVKENSLLSSVLDKKNSSTVKNSLFNKKQSIKHDNKLIDEDIGPKTQSVILSKGKRYLVQFKTKVVNYALNHNVKDAASKYTVNRGTVSEWLAEHKRLSGEDSPNLHLNKNMLISDDHEFLKWLEDSKFNLTNERIRQKTTEWLQQNENNTKCQWLRMYAHRLNGTEDTSIKKRYIAYPDVFKRIAVFHAQTHSVMAAARVFCVARRRILEWTQVSGKTREKESTVSNNVTNEFVDKQIFEWYNSQEIVPSSKQVRCKAVELYRAAGHERIQCGSQWYYRWRARHKLPSLRSQLYSDTRLVTWVLSQLDHNQTVTHGALAAQAAALGHSSVSRGWTFRFCKKHHRLLVALPEPTTPLPSAMEVQVLEYRENIQNIVKNFNYRDLNIIAMDEIPLHFLPKDQGKKPLLVRRPGFESCQASLVVSCTSDGTLLPSVFVFKGGVPTCKDDPRVISAASETGMISEDIMLLWLTKVCLKQLQGDGGVLITDCFKVHTTQQIQQALKESKIQQAVIPEGCAFKLLPVIRICLLFKSMLEEMCQVSLANQMTGLKTPSPDQLYHWSVRVHKNLAKHQKENIHAAFKEMLFP
ncbi:uncharacterized protein LOC124359860 isoform X2 [Homalodisca vitripennis]|nr:uncharacterized protein LOC124359860 isoform X2 [Homalodisca vitripennis]